ncbi:MULTISPECIES: hypothetical protein [Paenibacillus]|uniref:hypothetical protein n=1 Tax=Paenibacillus TaxID=44249 RepID=UPI002116AA6B|nr:hypothetical protein [Paenibacillus lautus]
MIHGHWRLDWLNKRSSQEAKVRNLRAFVPFPCFDFEEYGYRIQEQLPFNTDLVSFSIADVSVKIKTTHEDGRFQYNIKINSFISITEKSLEYELLENSEEMAYKLSKEMKKSIEK